MTFNGNTFNEKTFLLEEDKLNPDGLYDYAMNLASLMGVEYKFAIKPNGEHFELAECSADENYVLIPAWAIDEGLTETEYRATKGLIDHETGHFFWQDHSYLYNPSDNDGEDNELELIYDIGNMIDDIRIERRLINRFLIDKGIFKDMVEVYYKKLPPNLDLCNDDLLLLSFLINVRYRKIDYSRYEKVIIPGYFNDLFLNQLIPIIDRFIDSDESAGETAREIIGVWRKVTEN